MNTPLSDLIALNGRFARSANLERDCARDAPLDGYVVTPRALKAIERVAAAAAAGTAGAAWSVTGPYGSGKSSLALLLDAALGPPGALRDKALGAVAAASPPAAELFAEAHRRWSTESSGFWRGLVTAEPESLNMTVLRALSNATSRGDSGGGGSAASALSAARKAAGSDDPRSSASVASALVDIAKDIASRRPLLLVIDEFGKNLEASALSGSDPYLLQRLAEAGQGSGLPIFLMTLQHLSFAEHSGGSDGASRREWAKVQGRFSDLAFTESPSQTRKLIAAAIEVTDDAFAERIAAWARQQMHQLRQLGLSEPADAQEIASWYPLHPLAALALPEMCSRFGQHERTLFSFLAEPGSRGMAAFINRTTVNGARDLPSMGLAGVYDYFVGAPSLSADAAALSGRWTEIALRLRDCVGLIGLQQQIAKSAAVLNLVADTSALRASRGVLVAAAGAEPADTDTALDALCAAGVLSWRDFAGEYRVWRGSDVDIPATLAAARRRARTLTLSDALERAAGSPHPIVAAGHSARHDVLRVFDRRYGDGSLISPPSAMSPFDGGVLLRVDADADPALLATPAAGSKPMVVATPARLDEVDAAAREAAATVDAAASPEVAADPVACREVAERLAHARSALDAALAEAFGDDCGWLLLTADGPVPLTAGRGSRPISQAADIAYPDTPIVRNEMLNRAELTAQGAKARGLLLAAMVEHTPEPALGLCGGGPEVAMYRALLESTGIHRSDTASAGLIFAAPSLGSLKPVWEMVERRFERAQHQRVNAADVLADMCSPPFGMKQAAAPVVLTAALLSANDAVAVYEHGTFKPQLTVEMCERMMRNPAHFDIKHFAAADGARRQVTRAVAERLRPRSQRQRVRVPDVLAVVAHLVAAAGRLDNHTCRTKHLSGPATAVRDRLMAATEPDELLFAALPGALGFAPVAAEADTYPDAEAFALSLAEAFVEVCGNYRALQASILVAVLDAGGETTRAGLCGRVAVLDSAALDPLARAFVSVLSSDGIEDDIDWAAATATVVAGKAPSEWDDNDLLAFHTTLRARLAAFHRLCALHHEQRAVDAPPDMYRVTVTRPDGVEVMRLVHADPELKAAARAAAEHLAQQSGAPTRAMHTLLAVLSEDLLAADGTIDDTPQSPDPHRTTDP